MRKLQNRSEGFTIIEVLIVLAIAGLIMLIVFLAVPALQRNSRNTQRNSDASLISSAVNECLNNRNGQTSSCDDKGELEDFVDVGRLAQITDFDTPGDAPVHPTGEEGEVAQEANVYFGERCDAAGAEVDDSGSASRDYVVLYTIEGTSGLINRCISS